MPWHPSMWKRKKKKIEGGTDFFTKSHIISMNAVKLNSKKEHKHVDISGSHTPVTACGPGEKLIDSSVSGRFSPSVLRRSQDDY